MVVVVVMVMRVRKWLWVGGVWGCMIVTVASIG